MTYTELVEVIDLTLDEDQLAPTGAAKHLPVCPSLFSSARFGVSACGPMTSKSFDITPSSAAKPQEGNIVKQLQTNPFMSDCQGRGQHSSQQLKEQLGDVPAKEPEVPELGRKRKSAVLTAPKSLSQSCRQRHKVAAVKPCNGADTAGRC